SPHLQDDPRQAGQVRPATCVDSNMGVRRNSAASSWTKTPRERGNRHRGPAGQRSESQLGRWRGAMRRGRKEEEEEEEEERKTTTPCHRVTMTVGMPLSVPLPWKSRGSELSPQPPPPPGAADRSKTTCLIGDLVVPCVPVREVSELRNRKRRMEEACMHGIAPGRVIDGITCTRAGHV
ncbi:unnamed protein product, partial [Prorocentrum cordatum]